MFSFAIKKVSADRQKPFWLIAVSVLLGLTLPILVQDGMFMDAMLYTSVAHNLSLGIGTFWFPQFSLHNVAGLTSFHEQPPLIFGIQALFFKVLGNSMYVERFYTFITMCITAALINQVYKKNFPIENKLKRLGWLPLILWITIPICFWSNSNNMHENTMGIFTLTSVLLIYSGLQSKKNQFLTWIFAGIFIFLATLSKGFPGFFPITVPFLYYLSIGKNTFKRTLLQTSIITLLPLFIYIILFAIPESKESISIYLFKRALHRISEVPTVDFRFWILYRLFFELLPQILFVVIIFSIAKFQRKILHISEQVRRSIFFILVGFSASLPLMITLVQKGFYLVPSLPFFAIGSSLLVAPIISNWIERIIFSGKKYSIFLLMSRLLLIAAIGFSLMQIGKVSRNKELLHDVYLIGQVVPKQTTVSIPAQVWNAWDLQCYLVRYFNISLDVSEKHSYYLFEKSLKEVEISGYKKVRIQTLKYDLYKQL